MYRNNVLCCTDNKAFFWQAAPGQKFAGIAYLPLLDVVLLVKNIVEVVKR